MNLRSEVQKKKCVKLSLPPEEVKTLCMESLLDHILTRFTGLSNKEVSLKYAQGSKFIFGFGSTCATRCNFLDAVPKF